MATILQWCVSLATLASVMAASGLSTSEAKAQGIVASTWKVGTPIVTYWAGPPQTDKVAQQMVDGGWNLVWCTNEAQLDVADRHGLRAQLQHGLISPESLDDPAKKAQLDALIDRVRKHPALYSYFVTDEPNAADFPTLGRLVAYLRERDPAHFAYINLFPTYATPQQLGAAGYAEHLRSYVDVVKPALLSYDNYRFAVAGDMDEYFLNLAMIRDKTQQAGVPFLNIVQAASWDPTMRVPTGDEMRYLVYTTLAYGAQGISYYVYCCPNHVGGIALPEGTPTPLYHALKPLNREFVAIASELQPLRSSAVYHTGMTPQGTVPLPAGATFCLDPPVAPMPYKNLLPVKGILLGFFGPAAKGNEPVAPTHVVVVNLDYKADAKTTLVGPEKANLEVFDATGRTWSPAGGSRVALHLPRGGGKLVRLQRP
jgi:hypothetical protein